MIVIAIFCVLTSHLQKFLNWLLFFTNFNVFVLAKFGLMKECIISSSVIVVYKFFYNQLRFLRADSQKWAKIKQLNSDQTQIVPRRNSLNAKVAAILIDWFLYNDNFGV